MSEKKALRVIFEVDDRPVCEANRSKFVTEVVPVPLVEPGVPAIEGQNKPPVAQVVRPPLTPPPPPKKPTK